MRYHIGNKNMKNSAFTPAEGAAHVDMSDNSCQFSANYCEDCSGGQAGILESLYFTLHASLKKQAAFTLAEVLITLGIIGVVAALTMPALIANYQKQVTLNGLKKAYSQLAQAVQLSEAENGEIEYWDLTLGSDVFIEKYIVPFLKNIGKTSGREINTLINYKYLNGQTITEFSANGTDTSVRKLADGSIIFVDSWTPDDGSYRTIMVDINGYKRPNVLGKDLFSFWINKTNGLSPSGSCTGDECLEPALHMCNKEADKSGYACARVIIQNGWQITENYPW
mgnify:CR=1 FL=1